MKEGIVITVGLTDFDKAIRLCERQFDIIDTEEWEEMKMTKDFTELAAFLRAMDVDNYTFSLPSPYYNDRGKINGEYR